MILPFKLDWQGVELVHEFLEPLRIGAAEFVNTLVGVGQGNDPAAASKLADHRPFVGVRVLELVHDEYRVGRCVDTCQPPAAAQQFSRQLGEEVEVEQPSSWKGATSPGDAAPWQSEPSARSPREVVGAGAAFRC